MKLEVPLHITGFFYPVYTGVPETSGSVGAGIVVEPGVTCEVKKGAGGITYNGEVLASGPSVELYRALRLPFGLELSGQCAPGAGYAFSAASTLAVVSAGVILGGLSLLEAGRIAHAMEVLHGTGLGDVLAIWEGGGLTVRTRPGAPGIGRAESVKIETDLVILTAELGTMPTRDFLVRHSASIMELGRRLYESFIDEPSFERFFELSQTFTLELGLLEQPVRELVRRLPKEALGWFVKKKLLVVAAEKHEAPKVARGMEELFRRVRWFRVGGRGWRRSLETIRDTTP
jgi:pantoate kinase